MMYKNEQILNCNPFLMVRFVTVTREKNMHWMVTFTDKPLCSASDPRMLTP